MSTHRNLRTPPLLSRAQLRSIRRENAQRMAYQCVYCKRRFPSASHMPAHEAQCDARFVVRRGWAMAIERARRAEELAAIRRQRAEDGDL